MPVVDATARCVAFNDLDTHDFDVFGVVVAPISDDSLEAVEVTIVLR